MTGMRQYSQTASMMDLAQWNGLHSGAPSNVEISRGLRGFDVTVSDLSLLELNELLEYLRRKAGAA